SGSAGARERDGSERTAREREAFGAAAERLKNAVAIRARRTTTRGTTIRGAPGGDAPGEPQKHAIFHPAAYQRADAGIDLWPDRDRLYDGLRHHRHDQLRP